jgi:ubiquinone/menaquinone biosynthesis methyltransferase
MPLVTNTPSLNAAAFSQQSDDVFGRIASRYDILCDLFSLGIHRIWKREVARQIATERWSTLLDTATGTGDVLLRVLQQDVSRERRIIGSDISPKMLAVAERRLAGSPTPVQLRVLDAESMDSVPSASVDAYSISLGLKICNRSRALREAFRILRPGGRLVVLEASNIPWRPLHAAYLAYMGLCMPVLGWLATGGDSSAYRYLLQGIRDFPTAEELTREIADHGFEAVRYRRLSLGIVAIHLAQKPRDGAGPERMASS